jgi:crossover junction endodeoxyribonuclease RusA
MPVRLEPLTFFVPGPPVGKQRPRLGARGKVFTPQETHTYESKVAFYCREELRRRLMWLKIVGLKGIDYWFVMNLDIVYPSKRHPDQDNVIKSIQDGLQGVIWENDKTVLPRVMSVAITKSRLEGVIVSVEQYNV